MFEVRHEVQFEEVFQVTSPSKLNWENGAAEFCGLSIKIAARDYRLDFTTDVDLPGGKSCLSNPINVSVGPPSALSIVEEPGASDVYGGKAFIYQPLLHVVDAGGNIVERDSSSRVLASLYSNPRDGTLQPFNMTEVTVEEGITRFKKLYIAEAGERYRFKYSLWSASSRGVFEPTNITALGKWSVV